MDVGSVLVGTVSMAALAMDISQPKEWTPYPLQGGRWITAQYLQELPDAEAKWAFWYISQICCSELAFEPYTTPS